MALLLDYTLIEKIGEGTFSEVIKAKKLSGEFVAIKCLKAKVTSLEVLFYNNS
jgi:serine/threonine protein kinase